MRVLSRAKKSEGSCLVGCRKMNKSRGMTLIEIMIVVALIAVLTGTLVFGSGFFTGAHRRAAATLIVVGVRKGLAHANTTGKPVRLALDIEHGRITLEESSSREVFRKNGNDEDDEEEPSTSAAESLLSDAEGAAEFFLSGSSSPKPNFQAIDLLGQDGDAPGRVLGRGVRFVKIQTEHDEDAIEDGVAHLYFWPGGLTERAIVQIARRSEESGITIVVSALTGRAEIKRGLLDLPQGLLGEGEPFSEREAP